MGMMIVPEVAPPLYNPQTTLSLGTNMDRENLGMQCRGTTFVLKGNQQYQDLGFDRRFEQDF